MKKLLTVLIVSFLFCSSATGTNMPNNVKDFLKRKYPGIVFKIDNSFVIKNETYLLLLPIGTTQNKTLDKKIDIFLTIEDKTNKTMPKLIWLSNEWVFVKILKQKDSTQTILPLQEIPAEYKTRFLKTRFPNDLVIPKAFILSEDVGIIAGELPIKKKSSNTLLEGLQGLVYLSSPDSGKIIFFNLKNLSMISSIQTNGAPWEITYDKTNKILYVSDFAKDQIFEIKSSENSIFKTISLASMASPKHIELSEDGSTAYILESVGNKFLVYNTKEEKEIIKTPLPPGPANFSLINEENLIAITFPSENRLFFLNTKDFSIASQIKLEGNPEEIVSDISRKIIFIANRNANTVTEIDLSTMSVKNTIPVGETPVALALHPGGKWLYVANGKSNTISIIDLEKNEVSETINLPIETQFPGDIRLTSDSKWLIVTSETTNIISIIDLTTKKIAAKVDVGATTHAIYLVDEM